MKINELKIGNLTARVPVIQGGMGVGVSLFGLAGAVAAAGGIGVISTAQIGYRDPDFDRHPIECNFKAIGEEIRKARAIADGGIIGVNIMVATKHYEEYVKAAVDAGVDIIISGAGLPMTLPEVSGDAKIAPIVSSKKSLSVIAKYWNKKYNRKPDLVVIEGPLAGGHLGFHIEEIEEYTVSKTKDYDEEIRQIIALADEMEVPVAVAGTSISSASAMKWRCLSQWRAASMSVQIWSTIWKWVQRQFRLPHVLSLPRSVMRRRRISRHILMQRKRILYW